MMNKYLISIMSLLGLFACDGASIRDLANNSTPLTPQAAIVFDPANAELPLPNDLLFSGTLDGTLSIPKEPDDANTIESERLTYTDPQVALGALDGWSTSSPISITVDLPLDLNGDALTILASSVEQVGAIRLFEVTVGGLLSADPECQDKTSVTACKLGNELTYGQDFITKVSDNIIAVIPIKPLKSSQSYLYVATNLIQDSMGRSIAPSSSYNLLKLDIETEPLVTDEQKLLQTIVNSYENKLASEYGISSNNIIYSGLFSTQSVANIQNTVKTLMSDTTLGNPYAPSFITPPTPVPDPGDANEIMTVAQALGLAVDAMDPIYVAASGTDIYQAVLRVPIYGQCSSVACLSPAGNPLISETWSAKGDSPIAVLAAIQAGLLSQDSFIAQATVHGIDPVAALSNPSLLAGFVFDLADNDPSSISVPIDPVKHLTKFNPIPQIVSYENISVLITIPEPTIFTNLTQPANGWPSVIALHGLGGGKELSYTFAANYAAKGIATISIDMPLHGTRSYDADNDGVYEVSATDPAFGALVGTPTAFNNGNPLVFVNIESTLTTRDNFRQAIVDHLALRLAIGNFGAGNTLLDNTKISIQGLSLGAMVGTSLMASANTPLINPADGQVISPNPYEINAASFVAPTGGVAGSFATSATFKADLIASETFQNILSAENTQNLQVGDLGYDQFVEAVYASFLPAFTFAVQTANDTIDPINRGVTLASQAKPIHFIEIVGDATNLADQVLPNNAAAAGFPLSGSSPLATTMGLNCVDVDTSGSGIVRFSKGHHQSLNSSDEIANVTDGSAALATVEIQNQIVEHARSTVAGGAEIKITDNTVIAPCS